MLSGLTGGQRLNYIVSHVQIFTLWQQFIHVNRQSREKILHGVIMRRLLIKGKVTTLGHQAQTRYCTYQKVSKIIRV